MIVIANSTPLIALSKVGKFDLLKDIFGEIIIPQGVYDEVVVQGAGRPGAGKVRKAAWIRTKQVRNQAMIDFLLSELDRGEAEVLVLAEELKANWLIIDEEKARIAARLIGFRHISTVGVLVLAKKRGLVKKIRPILDQLRRKNFRLSDRVYKRTLKEAGE